MSAKRRKKPAPISANVVRLTWVVEFDVGNPSTCLLSEIHNEFTGASAAFANRFAKENGVTPVSGNVTSRWS